jgi:hypothetical protein
VSNELKIFENEDFGKVRGKIINERTILKNLKDKQYKNDATNNYISEGHYLNIQNIKDND